MALGSRLETSIRRSIYHQLVAERVDKRGLSPTNWGLLFLILLSLVLYTAETEEELEFREAGAFWFLNLVILSVFCIEFILRLYVAGIDERFKGWCGLRDYAKSNWFMMTVDFFAFAPELFLLAIGEDVRELEKLEADVRVEMDRAILNAQLEKAKKAHFKGQKKKALDAYLDALYLARNDTIDDARQAKELALIEAKIRELGSEVPV